MLTRGDISAKITISPSKPSVVSKRAKVDFNVCGEGYFEGLRPMHSYLRKAYAYQINPPRIAEMIKKAELRLVGEEHSLAQVKKALKSVKITSEVVALDMFDNKWDGLFGTKINGLKGVSRIDWDLQEKDNSTLLLRDIDPDTYDYCRSQEGNCKFNVFEDTLFSHSQVYAISNDTEESSEKFVLAIFKNFKTQIADAIFEARVAQDENSISERMFLIENAPVEEIAVACGRAIRLVVNKGAYGNSFTELSTIKKNPFLLNQSADTASICPSNFATEDFKHPSENFYLGEGDWSMTRLGKRAVSEYSNHLQFSDLLEDFCITGWGQPSKTDIRFSFRMLNTECQRFNDGNMGYKRQLEFTAFSIDVSYVQFKPRHYRSHSMKGTELKQTEQGWSIDYSSFMSEGRSYSTSTAKKVITKVIPEGIEEVFENHNTAIESVRNNMLETASLIKNENLAQSYLDKSSINDALSAKSEKKGVALIYVNNDGDYLSLTEEQREDEYIRNEFQGYKLLRIDTRDGGGETANISLLNGYSIDVSVDDVKALDLKLWVNGLLTKTMAIKAVEAMPVVKTETTPERGELNLKDNSFHWDGKLSICEAEKKSKSSVVDRPNRASGGMGDVAMEQEEGDNYYI